ncbi:CvpA family protein, partial [Enterococcus faecium]
KTSKVEKEFYLRCSYLTLSVLFDKEPVFVHGLTYVPILRQVDWIAGGILSLIMAYVTIFLILQLLAFVPLDVVQNQFGEHSFARFIVERTPFLTNKMYELWVTNILN